MFIIYIISFYLKYSCHYVRAFLMYSFFIFCVQCLQYTSQICCVSDFLFTSNMVFFRYLFVCISISQLFRVYGGFVLAYLLNRNFKIHLPQVVYLQCLPPICCVSDFLFVVCISIFVFLNCFFSIEVLSLKTY